MKYELKYLSVGELLGKAFNLYFNNFLILFIVSLLSNLTLLATARVNELILNSDMGEVSSLLIYLCNILIKIIPSYFATGLIMLVIARKYLDNPVSLSDIAPRALKLVLPLIGLGILQTLAVLGGVVLLIIPGIIFALAFSLSASTLVVEKKGVIESMKRSWNLTKGHRGGIFGYQLLVWLIAFGFSLIFRLVSNLIFKDFSSSRFLFLRTLPVIIQNSLTTPLTSCVMILIYFNLRINKEGFAVEHLTESFSFDLEASSAI